MGEQVAAGFLEKNHSNECFTQNRHVSMGQDKGAACDKERVNLLQQGSAVSITGFYQ